MRAWITPTTLVAVIFVAGLANLAAQTPCVSTGSGFPYVSTNPNYVCEAQQTFVYINVAQGYADPAAANPDNFNFSWYPFDLLGGTDTQSFEMSFDSTETIWCVALDVVNNCVWTDTIVVQVAEAVDIGLPDDTLVCDLNGFTLQPSAEAQAMAGITWSWEPSLLLLNPETATPQLLVDADQWYQVTATTTAPGSCTYEDSVFVTANVVPIDLGPDQELCEGESAVLDCGLNPAFEDIIWSTGDSVSSVIADTSGLFWVTALNSAGCERSDSVTISIYSNPSIELVSGGEACEGEAIVITANVTSDTTTAGVGWSTGEAGSTIEVTEPGVYEAIAVDVTGCTTSASISPEYLSSPVPELAEDTTLCLEDDGPIWLDVTQPDVSYLWSTGANQPGALLSEAGTYTVTLTLLANGCQDSASIELIDFCPQDSVYFPTAFTPDGDLINDVYGGYGDAIGVFELSIFNRWGFEVFYSEDIEDRWDGSLPSGDMAPAALYAFRAVWRPLDEDGVNLRAFREKVGSFTLIR